MKRVLVAVLALVMLFVLTGCEVESTITSENAEAYLQEKITKLQRSVSVKTEHPVGEVDVSSAGNIFEYELPSIDKYPFVVEGKGDVNIEVFVPAMAGNTGIVDYIAEVANKFNSSGTVLNEKTVSVSIRTMEPSLADEYITYNGYIPDAYVAENIWWGKLKSAAGIKVVDIASKTAGNVDGIILSKEKYDELVQKYGTMDIKTIAKANNSGELKLGYNDPFQSPTSLNFVISMLSSFDAYNPISIEATEDFVEFQKAVASVPYTTLQMKQAIATGVLDALVIDYQTYKSSADLSNYMFVPFGAKHDNPIYTFESVSAEKQEVVKLFADYCSSQEAQEIATKYNFNQFEDYTSTLPDYSGETLNSALNVWKSEKDAIKPVVAVFIADRSGSMKGNKIVNLQNSLKNASQYINSENSIGLISYASDVSVDLKVGKFNHEQMSYFVGEVDRMKASGGTNTYDAVIVGINELLEAKAENPECRMIMFVLSDGEWASSYPYENIAVLCKKYDIQLHVIGYEVNYDLMKRLAESCNGANIDADTDDISYLLKTFFNSQM